LNSSKVSFSSGAEPETNRRMLRQDIATECRLVQQAHIEGRHAHESRWIRGSSCMARAASNFGSKNIAEPLSSTQ
jgi:hypothetical protein